jgi:molybdenum cofactor biosynthesis enzyme MoaA
MHDDMKRIDEIPVNKMMEILKDLQKIGVKAITYSGGGEPLIHKDIIPILKKTLEYNIDLSILTNGQNLRGEIAEIMTKAKWLRVSMDYWNMDTFKKSRRRSNKMFLQIIENVLHFSRIKESCNL